MASGVEAKSLLCLVSRKRVCDFKELITNKQLCLTMSKECAGKVKAAAGTCIGFLFDLSFCYLQQTGAINKNLKPLTKRGDR